MPTGSRQTPDSHRRNELMRYAGIGTEFAGMMIGLTLLGWWIDSKWATSPTWTVVGATIGCVGGLAVLIVKAIGISKEIERNSRDRDRDKPN